MNEKDGTVANPVVCHEWPAAFDTCRERNRPIVARVGDEVGRCFPSGKFDALNSPAPKPEPTAPSLLDAAKAMLQWISDNQFKIMHGGRECWASLYDPWEALKAAIAAEEARGEERRFEIAARQDEIEAWKQVDKAWKRVDTQTKKVLESNESEISRLRAENAELRALMPDALKIIDAHRRITGGEGDTIAMNIRETIKEQGA